MRRRKCNYVLRFFYAAVGQILCAVSIVLMLQANIGSSAWNVFKQGLVNITPLSFGTADILINALIILSAVRMGEPVGLGSLFCVFLPGPVIDLILKWNLIPLQHTLGGGVLMMMAGIELMALSTLVYMKQELGDGPRDALMVALARKNGKSAGVCRACLDTSAVLLGWLLGGQVGIGTLMAMFGVGICIELTFRGVRLRPESLRQEDLAQTISNLRHPN